MKNLTFIYRKPATQEMIEAGSSKYTFMLIVMLACFLMTPARVFGQAVEDEGEAPKDPGFAKIVVIAKTTPNSVILRWAPNTPRGWRIGNRIGYKIERKTPDGNFTAINDTPIVAWMPGDIADLMDKEKDHQYLGMLLNALWSDTTLIDILGTKELSAELQKQNYTLYGYALFAADNDTLTAKVAGLRFVDYKVKVGEKYTYRISLDTTFTYRIDSGETAVVVGKNEAAYPPEDVKANGLDKKIELTWKPAKEDKYSGYMIMRSDDKGKSFKNLISQPIILLQPKDSAESPLGAFTDTTVENYKLYKYKICGVDAFGTFGEAVQVEAKARDLTPPVQPIAKNPEQTGPHQIKLSWDYDTPDADMVGFVIERSKYADSCYHLLTPKPLALTARSYMDDKPNFDEPYYIVCAMDTAKNLGASLPMYAAIFDTVAPAVPTGLKGSVDTNGVVKLTWHPNKERSLLGYRVLRAHAADHEFEALTGEVWKDTVFIDTIQINTLTKHIYYRIAAVNKNYSPSQLSPILALKLPAVVPPEEPVFTDVSVTDTSVVLKWAKSSNPDLASQVLYRRVQDSVAWNRIATFSTTETSYVDKKVTQDVTYEYKLVSIDSMKLSSETSRYIIARPYDPGVRSAVQNVKATLKGKNAILKWSYKTKRNENYWFVIFRAEGKKPLAEYQSVTSKVSEFTDASVSAGSTYTYAVKVVTGKGAESPLSATTVITVAK